MWTRLIGRLLALLGLYALVMAGLGMRFSGQTNSSSFNLGIAEFAVVTLVFIGAAAFMVTRRSRTPLE